MGDCILFATDTVAMDTSMGEKGHMVLGDGDLLAAIQRGEEHLPIHVASLRTDTVTNFDVYLRAKPGDPLVLYTKRDAPITEEVLKRLAETGVDCVYVHVKEQAAYQRYLEAHLNAILSDERLGGQDKSAVLFMSALGLAREVLTNPFMAHGIDRSKELVGSTVHFILSQRDALRHLLETASHSYFTYTHSVNACVYGIALAERALVSSEAELKEFGNGALLRDVGMSQIDPAIVHHRGKLTRAQFDVLRQHPVIGETILTELGGLGDLALDVVRHHHEKVNGKGYPDGLAGDEIHPLVRACTIVDIFDALSTDRPHRKALSTFEALRVMATMLRDEIDINLFRAFVEMMGRPGVAVSV